MDKGTWKATAPGVAEADTTEQLHFHFHFVVVWTFFVSRKREIHPIANRELLMCLNNMDKLDGTNYSLRKVDNQSDRKKKKQNTATNIRQRMWSDEKGWE